MYTSDDSVNIILMIVHVLLILTMVIVTVYYIILQVALKLLDCEFPDEKVRQFSTKVLEQMPDEKLEDFLLQLTQVWMMM